MKGVGFSAFGHSGVLESPYVIEKIALLVEVEVACQNPRKASEGIDGTGGQRVRHSGDIKSRRRRVRYRKHQEPKGRIQIFA